MHLKKYLFPQWFQWYDRNPHILLLHPFRLKCDVEAGNYKYSDSLKRRQNVFAAVMFSPSLFSVWLLLLVGGIFKLLHLLPFTL